ncbi:unnamed protein product, partial [Mesorhabditis belari]|uniref:Calcineurin-like phosphoesterase domain-containing protein n=1 Tax=Mesorhabditis belari TaxID=2138241 RepID=A0AAF3FSB8_9BILA
MGNRWSRKADHVELNFEKLLTEQRLEKERKETKMKGLITNELQLNAENAVNRPDETGKWLKFVVISDTHCQMDQLMEKIPDGDVLVHCGDFTNSGGEEAVREFNEQLEKLPHRYKIVVPGNHDTDFDTREKYRSSASSTQTVRLLTEPTILLDSSINIEGIKIYGSPWVPLCGDATFYVPAGEEMQEKWAKIPEDLDILITHGPPLGYLDRSERGEHCGDADLLDAVQLKNPKYHLFGHIHERYGAMTNGKTTFRNAAQCTLWGKICRLPIVFYMKVPDGNDGSTWKSYTKFEEIDK